MKEPKLDGIAKFKSGDRVDLTGGNIGIIVSVGDNCLRIRCMGKVIVPSSAQNTTVKLGGLDFIVARTGKIVLLKLMTMIIFCMICFSSFGQYKLNYYQCRKLFGKASFAKVDEHKVIACNYIYKGFNMTLFLLDGVVEGFRYSPIEGKLIYTKASLKEVLNNTIKGEWRNTGHGLYVKDGSYLQVSEKSVFFISKKLKQVWRR